MSPQRPPSTSFARIVPIAACVGLAACAAHSRSVVPSLVEGRPVMGFDPLSGPVPAADVLLDAGFTAAAVAELGARDAGPTRTTWWGRKWQQEVRLSHVASPDGRRRVLGISTSAKDAFGYHELPEVGDLDGRITEVRAVGWMGSLGMLHALGPRGLYASCKAYPEGSWQPRVCDELHRIPDLEQFGAHFGPFVPLAAVEAHADEALRTGLAPEEDIERLRSVLVPTPAQEALILRLQAPERRERLRRAFSDVLKKPGSSFGATAERLVLAEVQALAPATPVRAASLHALGSLLADSKMDKAEEALVEGVIARMPRIRLVNSGVSLHDARSRLQSRWEHARLGEHLRTLLWNRLLAKSWSGESRPGDIVVSFGKPVIAMDRVSKHDDAVRDVTREVEVFDTTDAADALKERYVARIAEIDAELHVQESRLGTYSGDSAATGVVTDSTTPGLRPAPAATRQGGGESASAMIRKSDARERISALQEERARLTRQLPGLSKKVKHKVSLTSREYGDVKFEGWQATAVFPVEITGPDGRSVATTATWTETFWEEFDWDKGKDVEYMMKYKVRPAVPVEALRKIVVPFLAARVVDPADADERALVRFYLGMEDVPGGWVKAVLGELGRAK